MNTKIAASESSIYPCTIALRASLLVVALMLASCCTGKVVVRTLPPLEFGIKGIASGDFRFEGHSDLNGRGSAYCEPNAISQIAISSGWPDAYFRYRVKTYTPIRGIEISDWAEKGAFTQRGDHVFAIEIELQGDAAKYYSLSYQSTTAFTPAQKKQDTLKRVSKGWCEDESLRDDERAQSFLTRIDIFVDLIPPK